MDSKAAVCYGYYGLGITVRSNLSALTQPTQGISLQGELCPGLRDGHMAKVGVANTCREANTCYIQPWFDQLFDFIHVHAKM